MNSVWCHVGNTRTAEFKHVTATSLSPRFTARQKTNQKKKRHWKKNGHTVSATRKKNIEIHKYMNTSKSYRKPRACKCLLLVGDGHLNYLCDQIIHDDIRRRPCPSPYVSSDTNKAPDLRSRWAHVHLWHEALRDAAPDWEPGIQICFTSHLPPSW